MEIINTEYFFKSDEKSGCGGKMEMCLIWAKDELTEINRDAVRGV
jgi:hypothetical protein